MQSADSAKGARRALPDGEPTAPSVRLSTSSVFPGSTESAFVIAERVGYDGIELMVGTDAVSADVDAIRRLQEHYQVAVLSVHVPCLVATPHVWGIYPAGKLESGVQAAQALGCDVVVVHPPFSWQRRSAEGFADHVRVLHERTGVVIAVENMYPWRLPGVRAQGYLPDWDPTDLPYQHLTLDLSHAAAAGVRSLNYVEDWGPRLRHLHLTDGNGSIRDEHLFPGKGNQRAWEVVETLVKQGYRGHIIHEVNTGRLSTLDDRTELLAECLKQTTRHISVALSTQGSERLK